jgi:hypothetical protein
MKDAIVKHGVIAMVRKYNCWDFMKSGKGPSGNRSEKYDVCPIASESAANGLNGGENGGRICWIIAENGCKCNVKCSVRNIGHSCFQCEFRYKVMAEEGLLNVCEATGLYLSNSDVH